MSRPLQVIRLGRIRYSDAMAQMEARLALRMRGEAPDTLFLLEHEPVLTMGRRTDTANILASPELLAARGIELHETGRGGDVTYHGPGQVVGYPVIDLAPERKDVRKYVADLEEVMIRVCARHGVPATRSAGQIGCWVEGQKKIGAIGVRISRWVTSHGFAFNVDNILEAFSLIVPCGIKDKPVTALSLELGRPVPLQEVMDDLEAEFLAIFGHRPV